MPEVNINPPDENAILKEVWNINDIEAKTELSSVQIESVNKLKTLSIIFDSELLRSHLTTFMTLQKSKDRKSMGEFVSVAKAREDKIKEPFMSRMLG